MKIIKNSNFTAYRNCRERVEKIKYIVIHYTGNSGSTAADNVSYFNNGNRSASAHYFVNFDSEIREYCDPEKWYAWHCGGPLESSHHPYYGKCTNGNSIGIEICTHNNGKNWEFTKEAVAAAVELTKHLMQKFNVPSSNVIRHYDVTGKSCPRVPGWGAVGGSAEWEKFKKAIGAEVVEMPKTEEKKWYRVRKTWEDANSQIGAYLILDNAIAEANNSGPKYAVFDWTGKEIYRYVEASGTKEKEIRFFYPGYSFSGNEPDDRRGGGCIFHDQDGKVLIYDAYMKNSDPAKKMVQYLKDNGLMDVDTAVVSHAHVDHGGGIIRMFEDAKITIKNLVCYDPASLKLAGSGSSNAKAVQEDKEYLQGIIDLAKKKRAKVRFVKTGDEVEVGEMLWEVCRNQPTKFTDDDQGHGWAYTNNGSINLYNRSLQVHLCGDGGGKAAAQYYDGKESVVESEHHGNGDGAGKVSEVKSRGCGLAIECNNEKNGPGSCEFTQYGARRFKEADIPVWMLNADIKGVVKGGKLTVMQGSNKKIFDVPFGRIFYRVRKTWTDAASQIGAFTVLDKAKECVDSHPGYYAFDETGKIIYPIETSGSSSGSAPAAKPKTEQEVFIDEVGAMARDDMAKNGILACITIAQAILESGWGKSELAVNAKNLFGMKKSLSGNTWAGSTWDGKSSYSKLTQEVYNSAPAVVRADFRAYKSWTESVGDHSAYLRGAKNGSKLRYAGLVGCTDYRKAAQIIKDGGYATAPDYVEKLCGLIEQYNLTEWNSVAAVPAGSGALDDYHTVKWSGITKRACSGYMYPDAGSKVTVEAQQGAKAGVCKGVGKFYLCRIDDTYGYIHKSHITKS